MTTTARVAAPREARTIRPVAAGRATGTMLPAVLEAAEEHKADAHAMCGPPVQSTDAVVVHHPQAGRFDTGAR
ncbi:hypothetical protein ACFFKE_10975 [Streptomyces mutabilis]|uniref:hypothetical protein n=1 Tax=Streptomyces mutabilis TaxID=67332 RepID=UPI0005B89476|nr:hypothetical protein [Streptomyces mutabilis]GGQ46494.1 hypothetical protein GCM10010279_65070 [Streptomyces mutabilis]